MDTRNMIQFWKNFAGTLCSKVEFFVSHQGCRCPQRRLVGFLSVWPPDGCLVPPPFPVEGCCCYFRNDSLKTSWYEENCHFGYQNLVIHHDISIERFEAHRCHFGTRYQTESAIRRDSFYECSNPHFVHIFWFFIIWFLITVTHDPSRESGEGSRVYSRLICSWFPV